MQQVKDDLFILLFRLENDLRTDVPGEVIDSIEKIRFITHLQSIVKEITEKGSIVVGSLRAKKYLNYTRSLTHTLNEISDSDIVENYKVFMKKSRNMLNSSSSSIEIIKDFLSSEKYFVDGVELTIQGLICATVKISNMLIRADRFLEKAIDMEIYN